MVMNPYSNQLADLPALRTGSKKGLDLIYKAMRSNLGQFGRRLDYLDRATAKGVANNNAALGSRLRGYGDQGVADVLGHAAEFGNEGDAALREALQGIAMDDVGEYQGYATATAKRDTDYQTGLRGLDKQYVKDLLASAVRERQARHGELEENFLALQSGLQSQGAMFDAQSGLLGFAQGGALGPAVGGGNAGITGRETQNVQNLMRFAANQWGVTVGGWRAHGSVPNSDHPKGLAADLMIHSATQGGQIAGYFASNAAQWGVKYVIWNGQIWTPSQGWHRYHGPNPHTDHVHVSTNY